MAAKSTFSLEGAFKIAIVIIGTFCSWMVYEIRDSIKSIETQANETRMELVATKERVLGHGDLINSINARITHVEQTKKDK